MTSAYWQIMVPAALGRDHFRPMDRDSMRAAVLDLHAQGLKPADIAQALSLSIGAVLDLLAEVRP